MDAAMPQACENCTTPLQGAYCHVCGQHAANPLRDFRHAVEDVFESFWHLDGRVFRTLRDLLVPGRVACNYLAGQRVRYIPPLRLFVILTVITFFVGQIAVMVGVTPGDPDAPGSRVVRVSDDGDAGRSIQNAKTVAEVEAALARQLGELRQARESAGFVPGARLALDEAEKEVRELARRRIAALRPGAAGASATATTSASASPTRPAERSARDAARPAPAGPTAGKDDGGDDSAGETRRGLEQMAAKLGTLRDPSKRWHEDDNPVDIASFPAFADAWFNQRLANMEHNVERIERGGPGLLMKLALAAVPPALFVLVPVFALLLRVLYPFAGRGYLEHLVVALYSHATMLLVLLATFTMALLRAALPYGVVEVPTYILATLLWLALPAYLFVMQHRVYRQHWLATAAKYAVLGTAYFFLVMLVVVYSLMAALTAGA
jgi:hypothetical protein